MNRRTYDSRVAFYVPAGGGRFESTELTRGPWDTGAQHAGPPAALLGRAIEQKAPPDLRVARVTFDIARPVPIAPLEVATAVVREGRSVMVVEAAIEPYLRATAMLIRTSPHTAPDVARAGVPPLRLEAAVAKPFFPVPYEVGYHTAMEVRFEDGSFLEPGPATAWLRMRVPLVAGEQPSPLTRVLVAADTGSGISAVLDLRRYVFLNPDYTVHLVRYPAGEWVCLRAATSIDNGGVGLADTGLHDEEGLVGRCLQSLVVRPRPA